MRAATALAPILFLVSVPAMAADTDTQLWTTLSASTAMSSSVTGSVGAARRFRAPVVGNDQWLAQGAVDVKLNQRVSLGGGLVYTSTAAQKELRTVQQVTFNFGALALRTQLDERFFDGKTQMGLRLRERAQVRLPIDKRDRLSLSAEGLFVLRPAVIGKQTGFDQFRFNLSDEHKLSDHFGLTVGYLMIYSSRKGATDRISHVPQLTLSWKG
jgi:hypothetical protein